MLTGIGLALAFISAGVKLVLYFRKKAPDAVTAQAQQDASQASAVDRADAAARVARLKEFNAAAEKSITADSAASVLRRASHAGEPSALPRASARPPTSN